MYYEQLQNSLTVGELIEKIRALPGNKQELPIFVCSSDGQELYSVLSCLECDGRLVLRVGAGESPNHLSNGLNFADAISLFRNNNLKLTAAFGTKKNLEFPILAFDEDITDRLDLDMDVENAFQVLSYPGNEYYE